MNTRTILFLETEKFRSITIFDNDVTDKSFLVGLCFGVVNKLTHSVFDKTVVSIVWELILVSHEILIWCDSENCK